MSKINELIPIAERVRKAVDELIAARADLSRFIENFEPSTSNGENNQEPTFPDPLASLLNITLSGNLWIVKPTQFLGAENFAMIANIVKQYGGKYNKSLGKGQSGYFEIPKGSKP